VTPVTPSVHALRGLLGRIRPLPLSQHPDEHGAQRPVLLAVDQQLGEGLALRVAPELSDPVGSLEVGEREDVEQLGVDRRGTTPASNVVSVGDLRTPRSSRRSSPSARLHLQASDHAL
jgi:hypothetical protein